MGGRPELTISPGNDVSSVGLVGFDTPGLKPKMAVAVGDRVKLGQVLFTDKRNPEVCYTSPGAGTVSLVNRGERRVLNSVVIGLDGDDAESFSTDQSDEQQIRRTLCKSGLWRMLRTRPFSRIPQPDASPNSIFVTAINTNPLAGNPALVIGEDPEAFLDGVRILAKLTDGKVFVCTRPDSGVPVPDGEQFEQAEFAGPHPAGLVGTHIHFLDPVSLHKTVWHIGYQNTMAIGRLFREGRLSTERVIALGGPMVENPRLVRTRRGARRRRFLPYRVLGLRLAGDRGVHPHSSLGGAYSIPDRGLR